MSVSWRERERECVCVCEGERERESERAHPRQVWRRVPGSESTGRHLFRAKACRFKTARERHPDVAVSGDLARFDLCCQPSTRRPQAYSLNCQRSTYSKGHGGQKRASQVGQTVTAPRKPLETSTRQIEDIGRERHTSVSPSAWKESQRKGSMPFQLV